MSGQSTSPRGAGMARGKSRPNKMRPSWNHDQLRAQAGSRVELLQKMRAKIEEMKDEADDS